MDSDLITLGSEVMLTEECVARHNASFPETPISVDNIYAVVAKRAFDDGAAFDYHLELIEGTDAGLSRDSFLGIETRGAFAEDLLG